MEARGYHLTALHREQPSAAAEIQAILRNDLISVVFQPIVRLRDRQVVGVEALSRFTAEPTRKPHKWFALAHEVGLGADLECFAIQKALELLPTLPGNVYLSVNVSPETLIGGYLGPALFGTRWSRIVLEVTEHAAVGDYAALNRALAPLKELGARLAVDDAGAGYASLRHIASIAPDIIKLDMSMAHDIATDRGARAVVAALVAFARESESVVVAGGVETPEQLRALQAQGVHYGQGYLLGKPERPRGAR
jgi:EAL domain-containing protein (putative c-di-GMP-specific phosphodiesterase class I)